MASILSVACTKPERDRADSETRSLSEREGAQKANDSHAAANTAENVEAFCKQCHLAPDPKSLPDQLWASVVPRMYELAGVGTKNPVGLPSVEFALSYYQDAAPTKLTLPLPKLSKPGRLDFKKTLLRPSSQAPGNPGVSSIRAVRWDRRSSPSLIVTDMRHGVVIEQPLGKNGAAHSGDGQIIGTAAFPADANVVDFDQDGNLDILVAELGTFGPSETDRGGIVWFRQLPPERGQPRAFEKIQLLSGLGRVAALRSGDLDGDGDVDLVIGMFGLLASGKVMWVENHGAQDSKGAIGLKLHDLDTRPGATDLAIQDFNGDGRPDILAVLGQHFEEIMIYSNKGKGVFSSNRVFQAPNPDWGMMRAATADLDNDGDMDIVVANGDVMDTPTPKYFHGIRWYENLGNFQFKPHLLTTLLAAAAVQIGDIDRDGDLDVVASAFAPADDERVRKPGGYEGVVWLEQTKNGKFAVHRIESTKSDHPTILLLDIDRDRDLDIVAGNFMIGPTERYNELNWLKVFTNQKSKRRRRLR
ncbi:MAG: VCBS repeat-containing protein [Myxococcota bacterium]|nr:VCBS repeat-containing protein [Myxococcota bacterium]